jgi:hypothetical protein
MSLFHDLMVFTQSVTCAMLGLPDTAQNIAPLDYVDSVGVLQDAHSDYVFYLVAFANESINQQFDITTNTNSDPTLTTQSTKYVRNLQITWQIYGDDGMDWTDLIRLKLMEPDIVELFAEQGISLIPDVEQAFFIPEKVNNQWFHRYDLTARFNQLVEYDTTIAAISAADVIIETDKGEVAECLVSTT